LRNHFSTIASAKEAVTSECLSSPKEQHIAKCRIPRYARVNTLLAESFEDVVQELQSEGWELATIPSKSKPYADFVDSWTQSHLFGVDPHIPNLLTFPPSTDLHNHSLYLSGKLFLQDKSSCLAAVCLDPPEGAFVLDTCAAPGMKTSHLASLIKNKGKIVAVDSNKMRWKTLKLMLKQAGVKCAEVYLADFLRLDVEGDETLAEIEYALIDPPCSGSGIANRSLSAMDFESNSEPNSDRLNSLGNLQAMLLKHALKLPRLRRCVYSTCSVHERENEAVIDEVISSMEGENFHVVAAPIKWKFKGLRSYEFGHLCLRASPEKSRTNGFFVCTIERKNEQNFSSPSR